MGKGGGLIYLFAMIFGIISAVNTGLAVVNVNLLTMLFGGVPLLLGLVYVVIGIAGVVIFAHLITGKKF